MLRKLITDLAGDSPRTDQGWRQWGERICAAVILLADGDPQRLLRGIAEARTDWRDLLVAADLAEHHWPARLDVLFGPPSSPTAS